jgi:ATP-dependent RNA helicase DOB1
LTELEEKKAGFVVPEEESIAEYYEIRKQLEELGKDFRAVITHPTYALPFLQPGRLVTVKHGDQDFDWGVVVNFSQRTAPKVSIGFCAMFFPDRIFCRSSRQ